MGDRGQTVKKIIIAILLIGIIGGGIYMAQFYNKEKIHKVNFEKIGYRELTSLITASGNLRAHKEVAISANTMGKIIKLGIREGQKINADDFLLMIDPVPFENAIAGLKSAIALEEAGLLVAQATLKKTKEDLLREEELLKKGIATFEMVAGLKLEKEIKEGQVKAAILKIDQQKSNLAQAEHDFSKVMVHSPISGICTRLNVEEGENVITGTMNNPGTILAKISDMSTIEVVLEVDETQVVHLKTGLLAKVRFDAFREKIFQGQVSEIAPGPIDSGISGKVAVKFSVIVTLTEAVEGARIGLSASADIIAGHREKALAVPISAIIMREYDIDEDEKRISSYIPDKDKNKGKNRVKDKENSPKPALDPVTGEKKRKEFQGVFVAQGERAIFKEVELGIAGERHFEVLSGLEEGDTIISGPYQSLRDLNEGDRVEKAKRGSGT